jgi:Calx-beta domain
MIDLIRHFRPSGRPRAISSIFSKDSESRLPRARRYALLVEPLERRELLATIQTFNGAGTSFALQQIGGPPPPSVVPDGRALGVNSLLLATTSTTPAAANDNSISFVTSDPGSFNTATADWDFEVTQTTPGQRGVGMSFALLNTINYGTTGPASSVSPQTGIYNGSLGFGFDTANNIVTVSVNAAIVAAQALTTQIDLASGQWIHARAIVNFAAATVSLDLTPSQVGSPVTVFSGTAVPGLTPYQSRVSYEARNSTTSAANFSLSNVNVVYSGTRQAGIIAFGPVTPVAENQQLAEVDVVRQVASGTTAAGSASILVVAADGTAKNNVNYLAEIVQQDSSGNLVVNPVVTFAEGQTIQQVFVPVLDDHLSDGNKTVNLYLSNFVNLIGPSPVQAALGSPITATLTIVNTDGPPPTVSPTVQPVFAPRTRRVIAFQLTFSQSMDPTSAQNTANYQVLLPPARKNGPKRAVPISRATLDASGLVVTLTRATLGQHLTKFVQIIVRGKPPTGLMGTNGTFLAGTNGVSGTDATLLLSL